MMNKKIRGRKEITIQEEESPSEKKRRFLKRGIAPQLTPQEKIPSDPEFESHRDRVKTHSSLRRKFILLCGSILLLGLIVTYFHFGQNHQDKKSEKDLKLEKKSSPEKEELIVTVQETIHVIHEILEGIIKAKDWSAYSSFVDEAAISKLEKHYQVFPWETMEEYSAVDISYINEKKGKKYYKGVLLNSRSQETIPLWFEKKEGEKCKWLWELYVGYNENSWDQFIEKGVPLQVGEFRLIAVLDRYYNYDFSDQEKYYCFRLMDRYRTKNLYGYILKDSSLGERIEKRLKNGGTLLMRAKIRFPEKKGGENQVEIVEYESGWL